VFAAAVPERTPEEERVTPAGRAPVSEKVGVGTPLAVTLKDPAVPTVKVVLFALVIAGAPSTVIVKVPLVAATPAASVTLTVNVAATAVVGVPVIAPLDELMTSPAGRVPELMTYRQGVLAQEPVGIRLNPGVPAVVVKFVYATVGAAKTVMLKGVLVALSPASSLMVTLMPAYNPVAAVVPEITPVLEARERPVGSVPDARV
jgi:hypothetical protein